MDNNLDAFQIQVGNKLLDYRLGHSLDLSEVRAFFKKSYQVNRIWAGGRHVLGVLRKSGKDYFLKLSTSEGISIVTENEYYWNEAFNKHTPSTRFQVPKNFDCGYFQQRLFFLVTEKIEGKLLCGLSDTKDRATVLTPFLAKLCNFANVIEQIDLPTSNVQTNETILSYSDFFIFKTRSWFKSIPKEIVSTFQVEKLIEFVESAYKILSQKTRHGDFTPWHIFKSESGLVLIDGEHAKSGGVEGYDICYLIQRVFSVLENPEMAASILKHASKDHPIEKMKIVLAARAIGGYLDESLTPDPNYNFAQKFQDWVLAL